jgi:hypothetical protein
MKVTKHSTKPIDSLLKPEDKAGDEKVEKNKEMEGKKEDK